METDYWHSLDRESPYRTINPKVIGTSGAYPKKGMEQLKAKVFEGASVVELGFMGKGKGNLGQGGTTPEMHSKEEREEMRQLAKINEVELTTHATVAVGGISGLGEGGFKPAIKEEAVNEIKRTVDFAADVAGGGPVVVHTGEFPRPLIEAGKEFEAYPKEEERRVHHLVDEHTGEVVKTVREDEKVWEPIAKTYETGPEKGEIIYKKDFEGKEVKDIFGKRIPQYEHDESGKIKLDKLEFHDFKKDLTDNYKKHGFNTREEAEKGAPKEFFKKQQFAQIQRQLGEAELYEKHYVEGMKAKKELNVLYDNYKKLDEKGREAILGSIASPKRRGYRTKEEEKEVFKERFREIEQEIAYGRDIAVSSKKQVEQAMDVIERTMPLEEYGVEQSADALARSAIYAYDKERTMKLKKPLFVAPENVFPEQFGAHPQELKKLILNSREVMARKLHSDRGITQSEAKKIADEHIKATFDVGHANTWKKFFKKERPDEPDEVTDKRFKKWMEDQVSGLQKEGIIGHVHISDNFGYYDEHLEPGGGNVPIKELAEKLQKHGYKGKFIAEWGAQPEKESFKAMTGAWRTLSSPVYKIDTAGVSWSDIEGSYFGRTGSPTYLVGDYAPSKDWTLWSETQLE